VENRLANLVQHSTIAPASVVELLKQTLIGTEGSLYQLLDTEQKIHQLDQPHFFFIQRHQKTIGTITICERPVTVEKQPALALYIRYFAFDPAYQSNASNKNRERNSVLDQHWKKILDTGNLSTDEPGKRSTFFWAFIDPQNLRSFNVNERFGFETIGTFSTIAFSRFFPKKSGQVERLAAADRKSTLEKIKVFYKDYALFSDVHLFEHNNYFVYRQDGEIVAGIQANPARFRIVSLPGIGGKIMIRLIPFIPFLRRIIHPEAHRFLASEGLFWLPGHENKVEPLLNSVLAITRHYSLLIWEDNNSNAVKNLRLKWGALQGLKKNNEINIVAKFIAFDPAKTDWIKTAPKYLSGFDMT
jgi:hypothetical protein